MTGTEKTTKTKGTTVKHILTLLTALLMLPMAALHATPKARSWLAATPTVKVAQSQDQR
ncbi:MAG: hypothetical protein RL514_1962 [Verrucomicrobiota bacterium]|jgi:hypothetical protein